MASIKVVPGKVAWTIVRGDTVAQVFVMQEEGVAEDVSARTYTAQIRPTADSTTVTATFSVDMTDAATGRIVLGLADTVTDDLSGSYVWDLQEEMPTGSIRTKAGGAFVVVKDVTRA